MNIISPCIWLEDQAHEAAEFYTSIFKDGSIGITTHYLDNGPMPEGMVLTVRIKIANIELCLLNGDDSFKLNPSKSLFVDCENEEEFNQLWMNLSDGGNVLMEVQEYPFASKYGWCSDRYGLNWQLILSNKKQHISPTLLFVNEVDSKAQEAIEYYESIFSGGEKKISYSEQQGRQGFIDYALFHLNNQSFIAMDGGDIHDFSFSESFSFIVYCHTQEEIDYYWDKLVIDGEKQPCGWLKDKFGVSWQIVYSELDELIIGEDRQASQRVWDELFKMTKIDIATLVDAYENN